MPRTSTKKRAPATSKSKSKQSDPFELRKSGDAGRDEEPDVHVFGKGVVCDTEDRGHSTPKGLSPFELVVEASEGFIPLWAADTTLRWRFRERSMRFFANPTAAKNGIKRLLGEAIFAWGDAAPVKFTEKSDAWDFEVVMSQADECSPSGCVLASAFFPDSGRHELKLYPELFAQERQEQIETLAHEIGHIFGLRHFFAQIRETPWASEVFGTHSRFSIMNYGSDSRLTDADKSDLKRLYQSAWKGELTHINGTPIRFVRPFHTIGVPPGSMVTVGRIQPAFQPAGALTTGS